MALLNIDLTWVKNLLEEIRTLKPDPRMTDWPFMSTPWPTINLSILYIITVKLIGPWYMKNRRPFNIRFILIIYNGLQVLFSMWLFVTGINLGWFTDYSLTCQPVDYSNSQNGIQAASSCWWYFMSKFTEFFDTFFFILQKKDTHISFLHAFHHGMMPLSTWFIIRHAAGGHSTFPGMLNTFVHVIMYFYYMMAALGPNFKKFVWWKEWVTIIQMIQFTLVTLHSGQLFWRKCDYPKSFALFFVINALIFLFLFSNFYWRSYLKRNTNSNMAAQVNRQKRN